MSIQLVAWALEQKTGTVTRKAVLLALANCHNHHTGLCCPSLRKIRSETELGESAVLRALIDLEDSGFITRHRRKRENGSNTSTVYGFPHEGRGVPPLTGKGSPSDGELEPELEPEVEPNLAAPPRQKTNGKADRDRIWDALTDVFGPVTTRSKETLRGKNVGELVHAGATPDEILKRAKTWPQHFDTATLTESALVKWWDTLGRKPLRRR